MIWTSGRHTGRKPSKDMKSKSIRFITGRSGGIGVSFVLFLSILLGILSFVLNLGYLYAQKNKFQNAVEAAAMAGAVSLCNGDREYIEDIVREIAAENGISNEEGSLSVVFGFYDEMDDYTDFSRYKDFAAEENMPADEYVNAVFVSYKKENATLIDMDQEVPLGAASVAFLMRIDIASLDPEGLSDIHLGHDSVWEDVVFFSNGDISYPQAVNLRNFRGTKTYSPPEFNNCRLYTAGRVLSSLTINTSSDFLGNERVSQILWDSGSSQSGSHIFSGVDPITSIRPVDDEYLEDWRDRADIIYTPDQAGEDNVFYHASGVYYSFDLMGSSGVIFFDGEENAGQIDVKIQAPVPQDFNNDFITNLTFVTNCNIEMLGTPAPNGFPNQAAKLYVGGEDEDQAMFISTGNIEVQPLTNGGIEFKGVVLRTGGDFILYNGGGSSGHNVRIIADGSIIGRGYQGDYSRSNVNIGLYNITNNSHFAPPCPPVLARLGRLEAIEE